MVFVNKFIKLLKSLCVKIQQTIFASYKLDFNNAFAFQNNVVALPLYNAHWATLFNFKR